MHTWYGGQTHGAPDELDELELDNEPPAPLLPDELELDGEPPVPPLPDELELDSEPPAPPLPEELALELPVVLDDVAPPPDELELADELDDEDPAPENSSPSPPQPVKVARTAKLTRTAKENQRIFTSEQACC